MNVYCVCQNKTYKEEKEDNLVWSPQRDRRGYKNAGYETVKNIKKGDVILSIVKGEVISICIAKK